VLASGSRDARDEREDDEPEHDEEGLNALARLERRPMGRLVPRGHDATLGLATAPRHGTFGRVTDPIVAAALAAPASPQEATIEAAAIPFHVLSWGDPAAPPVLLMHGVTSNARTWWRVGPAIAAAGYRVTAPDLPGHGLTGHWRGHVAFHENAADLIAFTRAAIARPDVATNVIGHSWGAMTAAAFPAAGYVPRKLILVDPPTVSLDLMNQMLLDPAEHRFDDLATALAAVRSLYPEWSEGDQLAKAEGLTQFDEPAVRAILTENGDWDGGLSSLADPAARDVPTWLIRGESACGGLVPDEAVPAFAARLGAEYVTTIAGAPHSPHRTHPANWLEAVLSAIR
jgi:pimeloyl-ACP methyl ester carboxylesterase